MKYLKKIRLFENNTECKPLDYSVIEECFIEYKDENRYKISLGDKMDLSDLVPSHIVKDFEKFIIKKNLSRKDAEEIANIFKNKGINESFKQSLIDDIDLMLHEIRDLDISAEMIKFNYTENPKSYEDSISIEIKGDNFKISEIEDTIKRIDSILDWRDYDGYINISNEVGKPEFLNIYDYEDKSIKNMNIIYYKEDNNYHVLHIINSPYNEKEMVWDVKKANFNNKELAQEWVNDQKPLKSAYFKVVSDYEFWEKNKMI